MIQGTFKPLSRIPGAPRWKARRWRMNDLGEIAVYDPQLRARCETFKHPTFYGCRLSRWRYDKAQHSVPNEG